MPTGLLHPVQLHQLDSSHPSSRPGISHHARGHIRQYREVPLTARSSTPGEPVVMWGEISTVGVAERRDSKYTNSACRSGYTTR